jgi:hypothetical protein
MRHWRRSIRTVVRATTFASFLALCSVVLACRESGEAEAKGVTIARLEILRSALAEFRSRHVRYPTSEEGLAVLSSQDEPILEGGTGPDVYAVDGWKRQFVYRVDESGATLYSLGSNGIDEGGSGDDIRAMPPN